MSPHSHFILGKASAHLSSSSVSVGLCGARPHPRGIVSDVAGPVAMWLMWALW